MTGLRPIRSETRDDGIVAMTVGATSPVVRFSQSACSPPSERSLEVADRDAEEHRPAAEDEEARADEEEEAAFGQDVRSPCLESDGTPRPAAAILGRMVVLQAGEEDEHRRELDQAERERGKGEGSPGWPARRADDDAKDALMPDERAGQAHLPGRDEVRNVALERTLGEVRAELEEDEEGED